MKIIQTYAFLAMLVHGWTCSSTLAEERRGEGPSAKAEGYAEVASGRIYFRDTRGTGPAVVFLHPASGNSLVFEKQVEPFVAKGYRVIAYDRFGQGLSSLNGNRSTKDAVSRVPEIEQLMDYLKIERFHLVGVAAGGGVALQYALGRPGRILSLVVANSIGNVQDASYAAIGQRLRPLAFNQLPLEMRELGPSYRAVNPEGVRRWLEISQARPIATIQSAVVPPGATNSKPAVASPGFQTADFSRDRGEPPRPKSDLPGGNEVLVTFAALETMSVPTLLLTGDADPYIPPSVLRLFKQHMPSAEMYVIPESGHAAHWENPEEFNRRVLDFLARH